MKFGILWHSVSTWMVKPIFGNSPLRSSIRRSNSASQSRLRAKLSSVMKKRLMPCGVVLAHDAFEIVGRAEAALAALHVDDGAERALVGAAAAEIDARQRAGGAPHVLARQDRRRLALQRRQVVHVVVERLERAVPGVAQHLVEAAAPRPRRRRTRCRAPAPRACPAAVSGSMAMQPETWKPPMQTGRPAARNGRARSTARGNWFDCTPTRPISAGRLPCGSCG